MVVICLNDLSKIMPKSNVNIDKKMLLCEFLSTVLSLPYLIHYSLAIIGRGSMYKMKVV